MTLRNVKGNFKMNLDVTGIINAKIDSLEESETIVKQIEDSIEKTVLSAITSALEGYSFKREIEEQISKCVGDIPKQIGFSAYNGFIAEKVKQITEGVMREDVAQKIQKTFDDLLITKHDGIKLSDIFNRYREWLFENTDDAEKWERHTFTCGLEDREDGKFRHYTIQLSEEEVSGYGNADITIRICAYKKEKATNISGLYFSGNKLGDGLQIGTLNPIESLLANLYYNKTSIILDVEDVDDDNHYDIDD